MKKIQFIRMPFLVLGIAGCIAVGTVAACHGEIGDDGEPAPVDDPGPTLADLGNDHDHQSHVRWRTVDDFEQMVELSHLVVRGRIVARRDERRTLLPWSEEKGRYLTKEEAGVEIDDIALTVTTLEVDDVLRRGEGTEALAGPLRAGAQIEIEQLGGELDCGCVEQPEDDPLLMEGDEALFFLSSAKPEGRYHVVGGWQGRFMASSRGLTALAASVHPKSELAAMVDVPMEEMRSRIDAVTAPPLAASVSPFSMLPMPGEVPTE